MTSREARKQRREQERKAAKLARKAAPQAVAVQATPAPSIPQDTIALKPSRAEINCANAQHSTGPVTFAGKLASSRNSLKHGLASGELIIPGEDRAEFESLLQSLLNDHQPANTTEEMLIQEMAQSYWLTQRALRLQNDCFTPDGINDKRLALFLRYQTSHERAFHKALNTLMRLKQSRAREQAGSKSGFVSQTRATTTHQPGFVSRNRVESRELPPDPAPEIAEKELPASQAA